MATGGFIWNFFKSYESALFLKIWRFLTKYGHESSLLSENVPYLSKYGSDNSDFLWKIGKKGILLTFLAYNLMKFWHNLHFSDQIWAWQHGFSCKFEKKWHESTVFFREWTFFWPNMSMRAVYFLDNGRFCHMAWEKWFFRENRKKRLPIYFFGQ